MKTFRSLWCFIPFFAPALSADVFLVNGEDDSDFDLVVYSFGGELTIVGGTAGSWEGADSVATEGDAVVFDYKMADGPGQWVDRISEIEWHTISYQVSDRHESPIHGMSIPRNPFTKGSVPLGF